MADDAGALLVRAGLISSHHLAASRALQAADGGTVGEHLVAVGAVTDEALTEFYRSRLMVPQVNPNTLARLANTVISVLPGDMAVEFRAVPVSLDKDGNLMVAMSDPSDRHAVDEIAFFTGKYVVRAVATQMQIAWCLAQYYGHVTELGERLLQPVAAEPGAAPAPAPPTPAAGAPVTRQRGDTARVQASRHRVLAPVTTPPPVGPRPGPDALSRAPNPDQPAQRANASGVNDLGREAAEQPPEVTPSRLAEAEAEIATVMEMTVDDPSGPVRLPSDMPAGVLSAAVATIAAATTAAAAATQAAEDAATEQPPGVEGGSPTIIISREATTPKRRRPALPDPPELAARSGEMEIGAMARQLDAPSQTIEIHFEEEEPAPVIAPPPVVIEDSTGSGSTPRPISDSERPDTEEDLDDSESAPILLDKPRRLDSSPAIVTDSVPVADTAPTANSEPHPEPVRDELSGPILLLERKKPGMSRRDKRTQIGIGTFGSLGPIPRSPETDAAAAAVAASAAAAAAAAAAAIEPSAPPDAVPALVHDDENAKTRRHASRSTPSGPNVDDGWGPPGTTIPPPFLGAVVPADDPVSGRIPLPADGPDSAPLVLTTPRAEPSRRNTALPSAVTHGEASAQARALEGAAIKLVEVLRAFDHATSRDHVIAMLVDFVGDSHHRVAFLAAKPGQLHAFMQNPPPGGPQAALPLSAPSVFQDVVGTRLPYRGPISDPVSREFVRALFGSTTDEMLAVPVAVRERVVGVIYADGRQRRAFDEHVAVAARAAGMALERLLKTKKS